MHKLHITPAAASDLAEIKAYISLELYHPQAARRIVKSITHDLRHLRQNPHLGVSVSAKTGRGDDLRALISGNYFLFYRVKDETIQVARVLDGRQDYLRVLFGSTEEKQTVIMICPRTTQHPHTF